MEPQNSEDQEEESSSSSSSSETTTTNPRPNLRREPSFSRWCGDDDGSTHLLGHSPTASFDRISIEVEDFELPLLPHDALDTQQRTSYFRQRGAVAELKDRRHAHFDFDVEGGGGFHPSDSRAKLDLLDHSSHGHHPHSAITVLKAAFYILVWYTFSTCLTL